MVLSDGFTKDARDEPCAQNEIWGLGLKQTFSTHFTYIYPHPHPYDQARLKLVLDEKRMT